MIVKSSTIPDVLIVEPKIHGDPRGFFFESFHAERYADVGIAGPFVQDNYSASSAGTVRGLHYQITRPQGKLVSVAQGAVFDVAVDLRQSSATFARWVGIELSAANRLQLWVPPGFAHGFLALSEHVEFTYKCTDYYVREDERTLRWDDPQVGIEWPLHNIAPPLLSARDQRGASLAQAECYA